MNTSQLNGLFSNAIRSLRTKVSTSKPAKKTKATKATATKPKRKKTTKTKTASKKVSTTVKKTTKPKAVKPKTIKPKATKPKVVKATKKVVAKPKAAKKRVTPKKVATVKTVVTPTPIVNTRKSNVHIPQVHKRARKKYYGKMFRYLERKLEEEKKESKKKVNGECKVGYKELFGFLRKPWDSVVHYNGFMIAQTDRMTACIKANYLEKLERIAIDKRERRRELLTRQILQYKRDYQPNGKEIPVDFKKIIELCKSFKKNGIDFCELPELNAIVEISKLRKFAELAVKMGCRYCMYTYEILRNEKCVYFKVENGENWATYRVFPADIFNEHHKVRFQQVRLSDIGQSIIPKTPRNLTENTAKKVVPKESKKTTAKATKTTTRKAVKGVTFKDILQFAAKNDELRQTLNCVYHENGRMVATNTYVLACAVAEYPKSHEGKCIDKNGNVVEGNFPNYLPLEYTDVEEVPADFKEVIEQCKLAIKQYKLIRHDFLPWSYDPYFLYDVFERNDIFYEISKYKAFFNVNFVLKLAEFAMKIGAKSFLLHKSRTSYELMVRSGRSFAITMPVKEGDFPFKVVHGKGIYYAPGYTPADLARMKEEILKGKHHMKEDQREKLQKQIKGLKEIASDPI